MKTLMVIGLTICLISGCTTLHPVASEASDLPHRFVDTGAVKPGDRVVIGTVDGAKHKFVVQSVHDGAIYGAHDSVIAAIAIAASDPTPHINFQ
jgi:hypothetical protein